MTTKIDPKKQELVDLLKKATVWGFLVRNYNRPLEVKVFCGEIGKIYGSILLIVKLSDVIDKKIAKQIKEIFPPDRTLSCKDHAGWQEICNAIGNKKLRIVHQTHGRQEESEYIDIGNFDPQS